ncbi:hypothetical protein MKX01_027950 [Papaver californicum]|nr:hypothetical protein MKX01_027950 [Papaver californicum]
MDTLLISSSLFISFLFFSNAFAMDNECSISKCGDDHVVVKFPFRITQHQHPNCGYPGFDLSCTSFGKTVIQLPSSDGEFFVSAIDYVRQQIHIHDPDNCLPRRLLSFDLSGSPFQGIQFQDYTFLNCSSNYTTTSKISPVSCLSNSMNKVFITTSLELAGILSTDCEIINNIKVPTTPQQLQNEKGFSSELENDLILSWIEPKCSKCDEPGWGCKNSTNNDNDIGCMGVLQNDSTTNVPSIYNDGKQSFKMALGIVLPAFILTIFLVLYMCFWLNLCDCDRNRTRNLAHHHHHHRHRGDPEVLMVTNMGLDGTTIESYPKITLGESRRIPTLNDGTCSICLSEYRPKDIVRTIPDCKHCFHAECIDEWLRMNASCPLCRTSPSPFASPLASPITQPLQIHLQ